MKKALRAFSLVAAMGVVLGMSGCIVASPVSGFIFTSVKYPGDVGSGQGMKMGHSEAMSILGWIGTGDASISAAANAGGITQIHHVDHEAFQVLGIFGTWATNVYGQ